MLRGEEEEEGIVGVVSKSIWRKGGKEEGKVEVVVVVEVESSRHLEAPRNCNRVFMQLHC